MQRAQVDSKQLKNSHGFAVVWVFFCSFLQALVILEMVEGPV